MRHRRNPHNFRESMESRYQRDIRTLKSNTKPTLSRASSEHLANARYYAEEFLVAMQRIDRDANQLSTQNRRKFEKLARIGSMLYEHTKKFEREVSVYK